MKVTMEFVEQEILSAKRRTQWWKDVIKPTLIVAVGVVGISVPLVHFFDHLTWTEAFVSELSMLPWIVMALVFVNGMGAHSTATTVGTIKGMRRLYEQEAIDFVRKQIDQ